MVKMRKKFVSVLIVAPLVIGVLSSCHAPKEPSPDDLRAVAAKAKMPPDHYQTGYISWGVDEFELFGLTRDELESKLGLHFDAEKSEASIKPSGPEGGWPVAGFHVTFQDGKVASVQRVFKDGAGCRILGPELKSQKEALKFSIQGLESHEELDQKDQAKLASARSLLRSLK